MDIKFFGHACFTVESKAKSFAMDPYDSSTGLTLPEFQVDAVTVSRNHPAHNYVKVVKNEGRVFDWPGEYETKGIHFKGVHSTLENGDENTIFVTHFNGVRFCHLGSLSSKLTTEQLEHIGDVDVLFLPVGGGEVLDAKKAKGVMEDIEPRVVIPMLYATEGSTSGLGALAPFLSEAGATQVEPVDRFSFKKSELPEDSTKIVVINAQ